MPLYRYHTANEARSCMLCRRGYELRRSMSDRDICFCPSCRNPVKRELSVPNVAKLPLTKSQLATKAKDSEFIIFEKKDKGVYEKV